MNHEKHISSAMQYHHREEPHVDRDHNSIAVKVKMAFISIQMMVW